MFEKSVIKSIVDQAEELVRQQKATGISEIVVDVGMLSNIDVSSLEKIWTQFTKSSVLEGARKTVNRIPGKAVCKVCCKEFVMQDKFDACPECHDFLNEIVDGGNYSIRKLKVI